MVFLGCITTFKSTECKQNKHEHKDIWGQDRVLTFDNFQVTRAERRETTNASFLINIVKIERE